MIVVPIPDEKGPLGLRRGRLTFEWMYSYVELLTPLTTSIIRRWSLGHTIDEARNSAVEAAIEGNCDFLFFLDWDTILHPETLHQLVQRALNNPDYDVFSAVYCCRHRNYPTPLVYITEDYKISYDWTVGDVLTSEEHDITGFGMGACLIRTSLFSKLSQPWFQTTKELSGSGETEDLFFLRKARQEGNAKLLIDTSFLAWHIDPDTGIAHNLPYDSLPIKRWREKSNAPENALPYSPNLAGWASEDIQNHIQIGQKISNCGMIPEEILEGVT